MGLLADMEFAEGAALRGVLQDRLNRKSGRAKKARIHIPKNTFNAESYD
jgi:hypothetical protein